MISTSAAAAARRFISLSFKLLRCHRCHMLTIRVGIAFHLIHCALAAHGIDSIESFIAVGGVFFTAMDHITADEK